ncbi:DNA photolyase FAD-binding protein [Leptolyngbya valderiana BDU 20041]|nr:DNA photolyase FAD-binding protein [Leptolyngbya valderiana BDU 20041]
MEASRQAALDRLSDFLPRAGRAYARERNHDPGPDERDNVSVLSPWVRHRLITEQEIVAAVLEQHSASAAEKFIQEVCWRTYWKGWLEMRPGVWQSFLEQRESEQGQVAANAGLQVAIDEAESGRTGIDAFDHWVQELVDTGYLHNHARMWFASIWIFTLKLPWSLGADFFLRHLLDADPASNTLSWRWIAGLQTRGKTYLARPSNIEKYTGGRFRPTNLAAEAPALEWTEPPRPGSLPTVSPVSSLTETPALLLIHPEDLNPESLIPDSLPIKAIVAVSAVGGRVDWPFGDKARAFVTAGVSDAVGRATEFYGLDPEAAEALNASKLIGACRQAGVEAVVTPYAPVGPVADALSDLDKALRDEGIALHRVRRDWDGEAWPHATKGFFPFKKKIPALLEAVGIGS